jgi:anaerobic selenocysteine-containing dehydrogenase
MDALAAKGVAVAGFVTGEQNNARAAETFGLLPRAGALDTFAMLAAAREGKLGALSLFGVNPMLHHPLGAETVRDALERVPFIVASELFLTESAKLAHLVLPARGGFEKSGHVVDLAGDVLTVAAAHAAPEGTLGDGEMLVALAAELEIEIPAPDELYASATAPPVPAARAFADPALTGEAPLSSAAPAAGGLRLAIATHVYAGGGSAYFDSRVGRLRPEARATFGPAAAASFGVRSGDLIDVVAAGKVLAGLVAAVDEAAPEGTLGVVDGLPEAPANAFADGEPVDIAVRAQAPDLIEGVA